MQWFFQKEFYEYPYYTASCEPVAISSFHCIFEKKLTAACMQVRCTYIYIATVCICILYIVQELDWDVQEQYTEVHKM